MLNQSNISIFPVDQSDVINVSRDMGGHFVLVQLFIYIVNISVVNFFIKNELLNNFDVKAFKIRKRREQRS